MTFAEKLTELRKQKGWSQEELGFKLGVTRQTVSKWELGSTTPEMEKLAAMSELFNITTDELIKGAAPEPPSFTENKTAAPETRRGIRFEYKSEKTWHGLPIVHINLKGKAKGVVAIGLAAKGIVAIGLASMGVVSLGLAALGVLAIGWLFGLGVISISSVAAGIFALGGISAGLFSLGGISAGWLSVGGLSAGKYAIGGYVTGDIAVGGTAKGIIAVGDRIDGELTFQIPVSGAELRAAILSRLPNTPKFIADLLTTFAENMQVG